MRETNTLATEAIPSIGWPARAALGRAGNLDHHVGAVDRLPQPRRGIDRARGVVGERRRNLQRDVAVEAAGRCEDRFEGVARAADVLDREGFEELYRIALLAGEVFELSVVVGAAVDRLLEDRRVRRHAAQADVEQLLQFARGEHRAPDIVEPDALAGSGEFSELVTHGAPFP
jgi:hypothetical protein